MIRTLLTAAALATTALPVAAFAQTAPFTTSASTIGDMLDNPAAKAIIDKNLPGFSTNPQVEMGRGFTLKAVQQFVPDQITDVVLAKIDAELAELAKAK